MSLASSHDDNDDLHDEVVQGEEEVQVRSGVGKKRTETQRSSSDLQMKPRKKIAPNSDRGKGTGGCCGIELSSDSESKTVGTSRTSNHIGRCKLLKDYQESDEQNVTTSDSSGNLTSIKYDPDVFRRSVNEMIVLNGLPFAFVESEGFRRFCQNVFPMYEDDSKWTATKDIVAMFLQEKASLKKLFSADKKRVSLTIDIWEAPTTSCSYMAVTAYWIDANWELQNLSFKPVTDHEEDTIARNLIECLDEWGIEKVFTVTVDNAKALTLFQDAMRLKGANALVKDGDFLHMRCCGHIVNSIVKDSMEHVSDSIVAVRNAVKYVQSSVTRFKSFELCVETGKVSKGSLSLDCVTQWNSTYRMLVAALKLRVAFEKMLDEDKLYGEYFLEIEKETGKKRVGPPISASWDVKCKASKSAASSIGYGEIATIEKNLNSLSNNQDVDEEVRKQATSMRDKFEKYWDGLINLNPLVIVASMFDPRKKMKFASLCFDKLYGEDSLEGNHLRSSISSVMRQLYEEYIIMLDKQSQSDDAATQSDHEDHEDFLHDDGYISIESLFNQMIRETQSQEARSELDIYLMEGIEPWGSGLDYDVLSWWKLHSPRYPILSELARDVLAIQVFSFASESAFSTSGRILDPYRSSLTPYMTEALICTQQWLRTSNQSEEQLASLAQMFEELEFHESLDPRKKPESGPLSCGRN